MLRPAVAVMQPTFLPWAGYFALLDSADLFIFLDDAQFLRRSWHGRNKLFVGGANPGWVSVPVRKLRPTEGRPAITEVCPVLDEGFREWFRATLRQTYGRSPHYASVGEPTEELLERDWPTLADLNIAWIQLALDQTQIAVQTKRSSQLGGRGQRSERIASLLHRVEADRYLAAAGAAGYMVRDGVFPLRDVDTAFMDYEPAPYPQRQSRAFVPFLSMLDVLLQVGPDRALDIVRAGLRGWVPWEVAAREVALQ